MKVIAGLATLLVTISAAPCLAFPDEALMSSTIHPEHDRMREKASYDDFDALWTAKVVHTFADRLDSY